MKKKHLFHFNILIILIIILMNVFNISFYALEANNLNINESQKSLFLNNLYTNKDYEKIELSIISAENTEIKKYLNRAGWKSVFFSKEKAEECKKYCYEYLNTYPIEVLDVSLDKIVIFKRLVINDNKYGGTFKNQTIFLAVDLNGLEREAWFKITLAHEFYHLRYHNFKSYYSDFSNSINSLELNYLRDYNLTYYDWLQMPENKFTTKHMKQGFVRDYSMFSKEEHMATIAEAVDNGAYKILSEKSVNIKKLMDAYIEGNIKFFKSNGININPEYYTEVLPNYIRLNYPYMYNYLKEELYKAEKTSINAAIIIICILFIFYLMFYVFKFFQKEDEEVIRRRLLWDSVLFDDKNKLS